MRDIEGPTDETKRKKKTKPIRASFDANESERGTIREFPSEQPPAKRRTRRKGDQSQEWFVEVQRRRGKEMEGGKRHSQQPFVPPPAVPPLLLSVDADEQEIYLSVIGKMGYEMGENKTYSLRLCFESGLLLLELFASAGRREGVSVRVRIRCKGIARD